MKIRFRILLCLFAVAPVLNSIASAANLCTDAKRTHQIEASTTGEVLEGPACVKVQVNVLRYSAELAKTISFSAGSNISGIFPSAGESSGGGRGTAASTGTKGVGTPTPSIEDEFNEISNRVNGTKPQGIWTEFYQGRQAQNRARADKIDKFLTILKSTIIQSDQILATNQPAGVLKIVKDPVFQSDLQNVISEATDGWRATDDILVEIHKAQQDLAALPQKYVKSPNGSSGPCDNWQAWFTQCGGESRYKLLQDQLTKLETDASAMALDSDQANKIAAKAGLLVYWKNLISGLTVDSFELKAEADCGVLFNKNKQTAIKLVLADRVALFDGQTPQPQAKDPLITVECGSPFSISAGVGFSTIEDHEFALVKSAPSDGGNSVLRFGESSHSPIHPMPLAMAHARLLDFDSNRYALHASFGVAAAIKGQDSGGSNAEYLTGLSFSFFRTVYFTGGLHIGQQAKLGGGFKVGDLVPPDITEPPVQKNYKVGFGFAVTFTKP